MDGKRDNVRGKKEKSSGAREKGERRETAGEAWRQRKRHIYRSMFFTGIYTLQLRTGTIFSLSIKR